MDPLTIRRVPDQIPGRDTSPRGRTGEHHAGEFAPLLATTRMIVVPEQENVAEVLEASVSAATLLTEPAVEAAGHPPD